MSISIHIPSIFPSFPQGHPEAQPHGPVGPALRSRDVSGKTWAGEQRNHGRWEDDGHIYILMVINGDG